MEIKDQEKELREHLKRKIFDEEDLDRHTLRHGKDKDLMHLHRIDEGY